MYKHILATAGDINWMAIFALLTFFLMFVISVFTIFFRSSKHTDRMAQLPLEDNAAVNPETSVRHEA